MLDLVSWLMRGGSSEKRRMMKKMPVYVVASLEDSPHELKSDRGITFRPPLIGIEKYAISLLLLV